MATAHNNYFSKSSFYRKYKCTTRTGNSILKFCILTTWPPVHGIFVAALWC